MANIKYKDLKGDWQDLIIGTGSGNGDIITAKEFNTKPVDSNSGKTKISTNDVVVYNSIDSTGSEGVYSPVLKLSGENLTETPIERTTLNITDNDLSKLYNDKAYLSSNMTIANQAGNFITAASTFTTDEEWPSWFISDISSPTCLINFKHDEEQGSKPLSKTLRYNFSVVISNRGINPSTLLNPLTGEFSNLSKTVIPFETDVTSVDVQFTGKYLFYDGSTNNFSEFDGKVGQKLKPGETYNIYFVLDFTPNSLNGGDVNSETHLEEINAWLSVEVNISGMTSGTKELVYDLNHCVISPKGFKYYVNENKYIELTKDGDFKIKNGISQIVLSKNALYIGLENDNKLYKMETQDKDNDSKYLVINTNNFITI